MSFEQYTWKPSTFEHSQQELHRFYIVSWHWRPDRCFRKAQAKLSTCIKFKFSYISATFSRGTSCNLMRKVQQPGSDIWPRPPTWILSRSCKSFFSVSFSLQTVYTQFNSLKINKRIKTSNVDFELCVFERPISNSLIIHEENTKEINTETEFGYVMKHLHKIKPTFISFSL